MNNSSGWATATVVCCQQFQMKPKLRSWTGAEMKTLDGSRMLLINIIRPFRMTIDSSTCESHRRVCVCVRAFLFSTNTKLCFENRWSLPFQYILCRLLNLISNGEIFKYCSIHADGNVIQIMLTFQLVILDVRVLQRACWNRFCPHLKYKESERRVTAL